jgi:hypothetical protein
MSPDELQRLDRQWLLDFYSLGAWVHQYTGTALYHELQSIPADPMVEEDDRRRIQAALRAKIVAEVAASHETLGRFCWAIQHRQKNCMAAEFINMEENTAVTFYTSTGGLTVDALLTQWQLPTKAELVRGP